MKKHNRKLKTLQLCKETIARLTGGDGLVQLPVIPIVTGSTLQACLTTSLDTTGLP